MRLFLQILGNLCFGSDRPSLPLKKVFVMSNETGVSSMEISDLTSKRHADVLRDIRTMLGRLAPGVDLPEYSADVGGVEVEYDTHTGRVSNMYLDKSHALTLVSGYDVKSRMKIFQRLEIANIRDILSGFDAEDLPRDRFVYVAMERESKRYKVGISKDPEARVEQLSRMHPEGLLLMATYKADPRGYLSETQAHAALSDWRVKGEWFAANAPVNLIPQVV